MLINIRKKAIKGKRKKKVQRDTHPKCNLCYW